MLEECIVRVKELIARRDEIDGELRLLLNMSSAPLEGRAQRRCSKCGEAGHRATSCPRLPLLLASTPVV
jgi:Zinc knuckle